ncbi:hypothetical protein ZWY2020_014015 [Hordeum vulgare]|nr:hypothetical protein ZWY2020_014015 [Hordeum vulgare]
MPASARAQQAAGAGAFGRIPTEQQMSRSTGRREPPRLPGTARPTGTPTKRAMHRRALGLLNCQFRNCGGSTDNMSPDRGGVETATSPVSAEARQCKFVESDTVGRNLDCSAMSSFVEELYGQFTETFCIDGAELRSRVSPWRCRAEARRDEPSVRS